MERWIIGSDGRTYGPADHATVRRWILERRLVATTPVATSPAGPWRDAVLDPDIAAEFARNAAGSVEDPVEPKSTVAAASAPPVTPVPVAPGWPPDAVAVPQLVAGIFNLVAAAGWLATCIGVVISVPLAILGIKELIAYAKSRKTAPLEYLDSARSMAILDICTVLVGNLPSAVCGVVLLTQVGAARDRAPRG